MSTIFSKIIAGDIPANKIYEDKKTLAFLDASPINPGHTLVIPKKEYKDIYEIPADELCNVIHTIRLLAPIIKKSVGADGINIHNNNEAPAGQKVFHFHMHIIPRFKGDGFSHWKGEQDYHAGKSGEEIAEQLRKEVDKR